LIFKFQKITAILKDYFASTLKLFLLLAKNTNTDSQIRLSESFGASVWRPIPGPGDYIIWECRFGSPDLKINPR